MPRNFSYPIKTSFRVLSRAEAKKILKKPSPFYGGFRGHPLPVSRRTLGFLAEALAEDIGEGDLTSNILIPADARGKARVIAEQDGIFCGERLAKEIFQMVDPHIELKFKVRNGGKLHAGKTVFELKGKIRSILKAERTTLNFLGNLSGISTATHAFVKKVEGYPVLILDTRKTTPIWRDLQKTAVEVGGGRAHRQCLDEYIFVKENHRRYGHLESLRRHPKAFEIEVRNFKELREAIELKPIVILLDNFTPDEIKEAVKIVSETSPETVLEASGGITLENVRDYAAAGVDTISIGALTHSVQNFDFSLLID